MYYTTKTTRRTAAKLSSRDGSTKQRFSSASIPINNIRIPENKLIYKPLDSLSEQRSSYRKFPTGTILSKIRGTRVFPNSQLMQATSDLNIVILLPHHMQYQKGVAFRNRFFERKKDRKRTIKGFLRVSDEELIREVEQQRTIPRATHREVTNPTATWQTRKIRAVPKPAPLEDSNLSGWEHSISNDSLPLN